jgi:hypothetical protein
LVSNPDEVEKLKTEYRKSQAELAEIAQTEVGDRYSHYFAVVDMAARLANEVLGINNPDANKKIFHVFMDFIGESVHETDMAGRAMRHILSWASANEKFFNDSPYESYGSWLEGEHIAIYPHKLTEILKEQKFSERAILKEWADRKWIKRHDKHFSILITVNNSMGKIKQKRMITIPWDIVEKFNE